jgi:hypothetical protein
LASNEGRRIESPGVLNSGDVAKGLNERIGPVGDS